MIKGSGIFGAVEPRQDGFAFVSTPTCLTADEWDAATRQCTRNSQIRGLGLLAWSETRFRGLDPCVVLANTPRCAETACLSEADALAVASCFTNPNPSDPDQAAICANLDHWLSFPVCAAPSYLGPVPQCVNDQQSAVQDYCRDHGYGGPDAGMNAYCWLGQTYAAWYMGFMAALPCAQFSYTPPEPPPPPMSCLDEETAMKIWNCSLGLAPSSMQAFCASAWMLLNLPYCSTPSFLPPVPSCLPPEAADGVAYCQQHGIKGPDQGKNTVCWALMKDAAWWAAYSSAPSCDTVVTTTPTPPEYVPEPPPVSPPPPGRASAVTLGVAGILVALVVGGGGYYAYRRTRRR